MTEADSDSTGKASEEAATKAEDSSSAETAAHAEASGAPDPEPAQGESGEPEPGPKKKKGKKKKRSAALEERPARDAQGRDRPTFLLDFPHDPELEQLIAAFESGNYARVRELAPRLIERTERADVKAAAEELLQRIDPDPLVKFLLAVAVALFVAVVVITYHSHG